jgi:DNA helicase II / ATP-dependent DNA helicase PcrA
MVICHRIEYLVKEKGVEPYAISCVTFTNRAAREMKERTIRLIGEARAAHIMMVRIIYLIIL